MKLTNAEEQIMKYLWGLKKAYMKNILDQYPDPKPATTTVVTLLKRMIEKGYVAYNQHGNNREYYPLIKKTDYFSEHLSGLIKDFFNDSTSQFASFFATETKLNEKELYDLKEIIEKQLEKKKK